MVVASLLPIGAASAVDQAGLRSALVHAAGPMSDALGSGSGVTSLRNPINSAAAHIAASENDKACVALSSAKDALDALPDTPATLPDRDGIRMILALAAQFVATAEGQ